MSSNGIVNKGVAEWIRWIIIVAINVIIMVVSIMLAYGTLDKRITILEVRQEKKIDGVILEQKLQQWKHDIVEEIKEAIKNNNN